MERKINIAEILKDKPQGTKLYTDAFGELSIEDICTEDEQGITLLDKDRVELFFYNDGRYSIFGEPILVPSKLMRDWSKFAWKKGDLLTNKCGFQCIFKEWASDDYTKFNGCYSNSRDGYKDVLNTETAKFEKLDDNIAHDYIKEIEKKLGGKLNIKTLEIEKQPEFKDGDIITAVFTDGDEMICVFKEKIEQDYMGYCGFFSKGKHESDVSMDLGDDCIYNDSPICKEIRFATDSEKQQLFEALAKEGKAWDDEKKQIVDLKPKWTPKPFDRVLVRNTDTEEWFPGFFEKFDSTWNNPYHIMNRRSMTDFAFKQCIPYKGNEHLLDTTNNVDG